MDRGAVVEVARTTSWWPLKATIFRLYEAQARRTESEADGESEHDQVLLSHQLPQPSAHGTASNW